MYALQSWRTGGQIGLRNRPVLRRFRCASLSSPSPSQPCACGPGSSLCRLLLSLSVSGFRPPSPPLQPAHLSLPHRGRFAFFPSARGQKDGLCPRPGPPRPEGGPHCATTAAEAKPSAVLRGQGSGEQDRRPKR